MSLLLMNNTPQNEREYEAVLEEVAGLVLPQLSGMDGVTKVLGVGSYYLSKNKPPSDLDYLLTLDFSLTDTDKARSLGESIEIIQKQYSGETYAKAVRSIVSIFLKDVDGYFINGEKLFNWYNDDFGFTSKELCEESDKTAKYRIGWEEAPVLWHRSE